jgi:GT2 family glycosyltransferase
MHQKFTVVIATTLTKGAFKETNTFKCISRIIEANNMPYRGFNYFLQVFYENSIGLSELYQTYLNNTGADYVVFIHDDLEIHDIMIFDKLVKAHEQYDIVGLAGSLSQDYTTDKPPAWHLAQMEPRHARGIVSHYIPKDCGGGTNEAYTNSVFFGPSPAQVVVIDGLFMSFKISSVPKDTELFDKDFTFHFYDLCLSCRAYNYGLKVGVWPIFAIHHGLGEFHSDPLWQKLMIDFRSRYRYYKASIS